MEFEVMSREKAKKMSYKKDIKDCIIISITDIVAPVNHFAENPHIKGILNLKFNDCDFGEEYCIEKNDGVKIIDFVNKNLNKVDKIVVHCEAGVSRSAGVCAALMLIITGSDKAIFDSVQYCPNMSCYRTVLETYYGSYDQQAADEKIAHNIKIWRIAQGLDERENNIEEER
jgi:hypothetical protein